MGNLHCNHACLPLPSSLMAFVTHYLCAWSVMGYMPAFQFSTAYCSKMKPGEFLRGYHQQLDAIFKSYQESEPLLQNVELPIGPNWSMILNLKCPILFVIQDMEEGDRLAGRFATRQAGVPRQCRACDIQFVHLDATDRHANCTQVTEHDMQVIAMSKNDTL